MSVATVTANAASQIAGAISRAARQTGISFQYLLTTARIESSLNPSAQAPTSSAKGLYQFIDQTWLATVKQAGPAHGLGAYANAIQQGPDGRYDVPDPRARDAVMKLRHDPAVSATMAGAFARTNAEQLGAALGRAPTEAELYIAHFLGSDGASRLITAAAREPRASAAAMFPSAASANRSIFYDGLGRERSTRDVYARLTGRFEDARATAFVTGLRGTLDAKADVRAPDTAGMTEALTAAAPALPPVPDTRPLFQAMFTDRVGVPLGNAVTSLWTPVKSAPEAAAPQVQAAAQAPTHAQAPAQTQAQMQAYAQAQPLDLFRDGSARDARALFGAKN